MKIFKKNIFFAYLKKLDPDPHQLENWDPDPHQNVLDPSHWLKTLSLLLVASDIVLIFKDDIALCPSQSNIATVFQISLKIFFVMLIALKNTLCLT